MTVRTSVENWAVRWTNFFAILATCISCAGSDFSSAVAPQRDGGASDASPEAQNVIICTNCPDLTQEMDAGNDSADDGSSTDLAVIDSLGSDATATSDNRLAIDGGDAHEIGADSSVDSGTGSTCDAIASTLCGGVCVDTSSDSTNCGSCGNICLGGKTCMQSACVCAGSTLECGGVCAACSAPPSGGVNVCSGSTCTFACTGAGMTKCGGACIATTSDANNCGSCGHGCLGGGCSVGQCLPVMLAATTALSKYSTIATSGGGVFWTVEGTNTKTGSLYASPLPAAGSTYPVPSKTLASGLNIYQMALDALNVYWGDPYGPNGPVMPALMKIPVAGGYPPATIASGGNVGFPTGVTVDSANLYVANELNILQVPLGGSTTTAIASASQAYAIISDSSNLYWTDFGASTVTMLPKGGVQPVTLATGQGVGSYYGGSSLAVDSANLYWLNSDGSVRAVPKSSGTTPGITTLVASGASGIAVDGTNVYWTNVGTGAVMKTPTSGGMSSTVASNQMPLGAIAVDSSAVYWTGGAGLMAVAK